VHIEHHQGNACEHVLEELGFLVVNWAYPRGVILDIFSVVPDYPGPHLCQIIFSGPLPFEALKMNALFYQVVGGKKKPPLKDALIASGLAPLLA
jgi:hypothetical protein